MCEVSVHEARKYLSRLIKQAQAGEDIVIVSHGKPVARLVPIRSASTGREIAGWLRTHQMDPQLVRSKAQIDADIAAERHSWE